MNTLLATQAPAWCGNYRRKVIRKWGLKLNDSTRQSSKLNPRENKCAIGHDLPAVNRKVITVAAAE
jgi:hypothetical protein